MKNLLLALALCGMTSAATPPVVGGYSASGQAAVASYNAMVVCMTDMSNAMAGIQDKATAEANAATVLKAGKELKTLLENTDEPYSMGKKAVTHADAFALRDCRYRMMTAGMAVQQEMLRLAKAEFYNSAALIKALQELEMLHTDTDSLIR